jgi:hypothetical protein
MTSESMGDFSPLRLNLTGNSQEAMPQEGVMTLDFTRR